MFFKKSKASETEELVELILSRYTSKNTQNQYRRLVTELCEFLGISQAALASVKRADAMQYLRWCRSRKGQEGRYIGQSERVCEATVKRKHQVLRSIFEELVENASMKENPFRFPVQNASSEPEKRPTQPIPFELVKKICTAPDSFSFKGIQDRAFLATLFGNGGRRGELSQLCMGHITKLENGSISYTIVKSKRQRMEVKVLPKWASELLQAHLDQRESMGASSRDPVFIGPSGEALSSDSVYRRFKYWIGNLSDQFEALDPKMYSPHSARATMATYLDSQGASISEIKKVGCWSSSQSAERYIKRSFDERNHPALGVEYE